MEWTTVIKIPFSQSDRPKRMRVSGYSFACERLRRDFSAHVKLIDIHLPFFPYLGTVCVHHLILQSFIRTVFVYT